MEKDLIWGKTREEVWVGFPVDAPVFYFTYGQVLPCWFMPASDFEVPIEIVRQGMVEIYGSEIIEKTDSTILVSLRERTYDCRVTMTRCYDGIPSMELRMLPSAVEKDKKRTIPRLNHTIDQKVLTIIKFPTLKYWQIFCASQTMFTVNVCFRPLGTLGRAIAEAGKE